MLTKNQKIAAEILNDHLLNGSDPTEVLAAGPLFDAYFAKVGEWTGEQQAEFRNAALNVPADKAVGILAAIVAANAAVDAPADENDLAFSEG